MRGLGRGLGIAGLALALFAFAPNAGAQTGDARVRGYLEHGQQRHCRGQCAAADRARDARVRGYLEHGQQRHTALGYGRTHTPDLLRPMRLDHPFLWTMTLRAGVNYRIYAACDDSCGDVDMEIYGADGELADRDTARNDTPYLQITPTRTGRHQVRLWLYDCRAETCLVAARVLAGGTPAERPSPPPEQ